jgi:hypothetical protein
MKECAGIAIFPSDAEDARTTPPDSAPISIGTGLVEAAAGELGRLFVNGAPGV